MKGGIGMAKIYGYCLTVTARGKREERLEEQKKAIKEIYPDAEIIEEVMGLEKFNRKKFNEIIDKCEKGDMIVCYRLDRFCKSTKEGIRVADKLLSKGAKAHILNMGIIDDSESGKLIYKTLQAFDVFQHECKLDKMNVARKPENIGRKKKFTKEQIDNALKLLDKYSYAEVAEKTGISTGTLCREKKFREEDEQ